jgi:hypothetical protein
MRLRLGLLAFLPVLAAPALAQAESPTFVTSKVAGTLVSNGSEPRIAVAPDNTRYVSTNEGEGDVQGWPFKVFRSIDGGLSWQKTAGDPVQRAASIDTDMIALSTGRLLASELDYGGLNFPTSISDDGGKTWTESHGSTELSDQDRQWFAPGPVPKGSPPGTQPPVYFLYHNFASGVAQHNMWVATSNDGGATFGPPVPTAQPGSDAYQDLQCSDSGGPSNITVNPDTGHIYVVFTTRAAPTPAGLDLGGCASTPLEFNIVNGTRVWVADSPNGLPGTWHDSLAVDDSGSGQVVSMQLAYGALDNAGNFYVAYPESPKAYPNLAGAAIKLRWLTPNADGVLDGNWSKPATLVPAEVDGSGNPQNGTNLVHIVAGDPGDIAVGFYKAEAVPGAKAPVWYTHILQSFDAMSDSPHVSDYKVPGLDGGAPIPTYQWTASQMMGVCSDPNDPTGGIQNGLNCPRSTDVWGIALDAQCQVMITWPAFGSHNQDGSTNQDGAVIPNHDDGTFTTTQTDGPGLCPSGSLPGGSQGLPFRSASTASGAGGGGGKGGTGTNGTGKSQGGCADKVPPVSHKVGRVRANRKGIRLHGVATDRGCGVKGAAAQRRVRSMSVAIGRRLANRKCRFLLGSGKFGPQRSCLRTTYLVARGTSKWSFSIKAKLPRGRYVVWSRGVDIANNVEKKNRKRNLARFKVH